MGLQDSMNTRIGGWGVKGLSGGEKRRVSICIEILTHPKLLFLDEPTSGLDSAASYYVMSRIARLDQREGRTIVASIHQPSSEVFGLFNNLCLLSGGKTIYFGPANSANEFFALSGFPCPNFYNPADFYLRTINKDFVQDIEEGSSSMKPIDEVISILIKSYKSSYYHQEVLRKVRQIDEQGVGVMEKRNSHASFLTQCLVLTRRSSVNMYRELAYYRLRLASYIVISICLGTIFYDVGTSYSSIQARGSMLMYESTFLTFMAIGGFPSFVEDMKVFERERLNGHYVPAAFVIANTLSSIPYLFLISLIPGAIAYYLTGLRSELNYFAYFTLVMFVSMLSVESLMMVIASIVPNYLMGIILGSGVQGVMILAAGFFRLPSDMPAFFWRYPLYFISLHKYAYQGLYKNEFEAHVFNYDQGGTRKVIYGENILKETFQVEMGYSKWVDLVIILVMLFFYRFLFLVIVTSLEKIKPILRAFMSGPRKQKEEQLMVNPLATPSHIDATP